MTKKLATITSIALLVAACVPAPKKAYSPDEAKALDDLSEMMRLNAQQMDPLFSIENDASYDDEAFARMSSAAALVGGSSSALKEKIAPAFPAGFGKHADTMIESAAKLSAASSAKDAKGAGEAIRAIHQACKGCHSEFR